MKTKTNMKNRLGNGGFSLVELIVVIAIMAILAAVAVIGVSVYVDKAAEAADKQTVTDIEDALVLGGYSGGYAPGTVVGAVGISKDADATASNAEIEKIMVDAFGANWKSELKLQSDSFASSTDAAQLIAAINANRVLFDSVPDSSFYKIEGNTEALVADVDEIAGALSGVLSITPSAFSMFWGEDFHNSVGSAGLTNDWKGDPQMAANLTVFAAANQLNKVATNDKDQLDAWTESWKSGDGQTISVSASKKGYVADVVMNYAQCVAAYNWALAKDKQFAEEEYASAYELLEDRMAALKDSSDYVTDFNKALQEFWTNTGTLRADWQNDAAAEDAKAFLASMMAVNSLENNYVSKDQKELLGSVNAFDKAGAADVLDTMVNYSKIDTAISGDYAIVLSIAADGTPVVTPAISRD